MLVCFKCNAEVADEQEGAKNCERKLFAGCSFIHQMVLFNGCGRLPSSLLVGCCCCYVFSFISIGQNQPQVPLHEYQIWFLVGCLMLPQRFYFNKIHYAHSAGAAGCWYVWWPQPQTFNGFLVILILIMISILWLTICNLMRATHF